MSNLSRYDDDFRNSKPEATAEKEYDKIPDGKYIALIDEVDVVRTKSNEDALKWVFIIQDAKYKGRKLWKYSLFRKELYGYLKKDLKTCGVEIERLSDLEDYLEGMLGIKLEITLKTSGEYQNVFINKQI